MLLYKLQLYTYSCTVISISGKDTTRAECTYDEWKCARSSKGLPAEPCPSRLDVCRVPCRVCVSLGPGPCTVHGLVHRPRLSAHIRRQI